MAKLNAEQRVQKSHVWLMKNPKYCLYSGIFMIGQTEIKDDIPTACTDGKNTYYGREFVDKLSEAHVKGIVLHENLHKAFRHTTVWKHLYKEHAQLANMACDYVINQMIVDGDTNMVEVGLPDCALLDPKYKGWDAGTVYRDLKQQADKGSVHVKTLGNPEGRDVPVEDGDGLPSLDEHDWENAEGLSNEEREQLAKDIDQALRQGAILAGKMNGNVPREITDALQAKVDWRDALREFVNSFCMDKDESTWRRPSRRWIGQDVYMPSLIGESVGRIVVGIDMSGSIGQAEIGQFLGELLSVCNHVQPEAIDLLYWDTAVAGHEVYNRGDYEALMTSTKPAGGGGTDPECVPKYLAKQKMTPECVIMLTDGYVGSWGNWKDHVFWGITSRGITAGNGVSVYVGDQ